MMPQGLKATGIRETVHSADGLRLLLKIAGDLYLPFLVANAEAFAKELERVEIEAWGLPYTLAPFKYQVKCLQQLRSKFAALDAQDRAALHPLFAHTGCWQPLVAG